MTDLSTATPLEIDTDLADLARREQEARRDLARVTVKLHYSLDERARYVTRNRKEWPTSDQEALAAVRAKADAGERMSLTHGGKPYADLVSKFDATVAALTKIRDAAAVLNAEYKRRPWSRFFLVTSSDGHIHRDMNCSTCRPTTEYGWLPQLSGKTEAEAVADQGPLLCTVCYPTARPDWTRGREPKSTNCLGGSAYADPAAPPKSFGQRLYGTCPTCKEAGIQVNANGNVRAHSAKKTDQ